MPHRFRKGGRRGFTLIELLIVMTIMLLLAAMLVPGLHTAREYAQRVRCASNLRGIGTAFHTFLADSKGLAMPMTDSYGVPATYPFGLYQGPNQPINFELGFLSAGTGLDPEVWQCPAFGPGDYAPRVLGRSTGYGYNYQYLSPTAPNDPWLPLPVSMSSVRRPTRMVVFGDSARDWNGPVEENWWWTPPSQGIPFGNHYTHFRHTLKANVLFVDNHVDALPPRLGTLNLNKLGVLAPDDLTQPVDYYFDGR